MIKTNNLQNKHFQEKITRLENENLKERLKNRTEYAFELKTVLQGFYEGKAYNVISKFWEIVNVIYMFCFIAYSIVFKQDRRNYLLSEEKLYDRMEYLDKILVSSSYKAVKFYWDVKNLVRTLIINPAKIVSLVPTWT